MTMAASTFVSGVTALIRVGRALRDEYRARLRARPFQALLPPNCPVTASGDAIRVATLDWLREFRPELIGEQGPFFGMFRDPAAARPVLSEAGHGMIDDAIEAYLAQFGGAEALQIDGKAVPVTRVAMLAHREWVEESRRPRWGRLGLEVADIALDIISVQPDVLGLNRRATEIIGALAANMNSIVENNDVGDGSPESPGERLAKSFVRASLETVAERPELFVSADRWKPIVSGVVVPLAEQAARGGGELASAERLRAFLRGPVAHSVLTALNANADAFLTSRFGGDQALGAVARSVLGAITAPGQGRFDLRDIFSGDGAVLVYQSALDVARAQPELFIRGLGAESDAGRRFLTGVCAALDAGPEAFRASSGLAPQIASIAFEVAGAYASRRIRTSLETSAATDPWAAVGAEVADHLLGSVLQGFSEGAGAGRAFERLFSREQAVDVLRIVSMAVAETPQMAVGQGAGAEVRNIARGLAAMMSEQAAGLMKGEDWRALVAHAMTLTARNPGVLFRIDAAADPRSQIGVTLVSTLLERAAVNMEQGRRPGAILFGDTLREAIVATLDAAASKLLVPGTAPGDLALHFDAAAAGDHVAALGGFAKHLLDLAGGQDPLFRMSADEWLYVYRELVAHVLAEGPKAFPVEGADPVEAASHVTDQVILGILQSAADRVTSRASAAPAATVVAPAPAPAQPEGDVG